MLLLYEQQFKQADHAVVAAAAAAVGDFLSYSCSPTGFARVQALLIAPLILCVWKAFDKKT